MRKKAQRLGKIMHFNRFFYVASPHVFWRTEGTIVWKPINFRCDLTGSLLSRFPSPTPWLLDLPIAATKVELSNDLKSNGCDQGRRLQTARDGQELDPVSASALLQSMAVFVLILILTSILILILTSILILILIVPWHR